MPGGKVAELLARNDRVSDSSNPKQFFMVDPTGSPDLPQSVHDNDDNCGNPGIYRTPPPFGLSREVLY